MQIQIISSFAAHHAIVAKFIQTDTEIEGIRF